MILTVTLNAALDRTVTVPNFEVGFRHRAIDTLSLPGGKGVNVARTIKTLGQPVIATGFLGGRTGDRILADLTREGILCDFVRIEQESRTSTAVLDPAENAATEINEYGPEISPRELELMYEKLDYLSRAADVVVLAGSLPRGLEPGIYGSLMAFLHNLHALTLFDTFGDPLRQGIKAGPDVVFPNQEEAEMIIGYEFSADDDFLAAARGLRELGAGSVVIKSRQGCAAQIVEQDGRVRSFVGRAPQVTAVSSVGSGDALVGGYSVAMRRNLDAPACLRLALACAAANTLCAGAGVFYPDDVDRLSELVEIEEVGERVIGRTKDGLDAVAKVLVLDFGAQYGQLIARRVRECRVYSELISYDTPVEELRAARPAGIILSGGPRSVNDPGAPMVDPAVLELGVPVLGICYGTQLLAKHHGGRVARADLAEYGGTAMSVVAESRLFADLPVQQPVWMSHGDSVLEAPAGFTVTARSAQLPIAAMEDAARGLYGVQFHPEVRHTKYGQDILKNFLYRICDIAPTWTPVSIIEEAVDRIQAQVGTRKVICGLSGGVDSSVAALLTHKAVGDQLTCIFVDHGLMRKDEGEQVEDAFRRHFHVPLVHVQAQERFLSKLAGVTEPEQKRKIIGTEFIRTFEEEAAKLGDVHFLVQGTLYPDVIESGTKNAAVIKSHHNVGGLPDDMAFALVEPLRMLFKDEVRAVGEELGLPEAMVWRQPFPGPGLGIRIIGEVTQERLHILREADAVFLEEIRRAGLYREIWQGFAVLPAIRSVGVMGDERTYAYPIVIRAVTSDDAMTADWARIPFDVLERISSRIINEVPGVNRVALDISSKPPSTIEWE